MIGGALLPEVAESRAAAGCALVAGAASVLLAAVPVELWVAPLALMAPRRSRILVLAAMAGVYAALIGLHAAGRDAGDSGVVRFLIETTGTSGIAAFQQAQERWGDALGLVVGWAGPRARDTALMCGQRGHDPLDFAIAVLGHVLGRGLLLSGLLAFASRRAPVIDLARKFTLPWWFLLLAISFVAR